MTVDQLNGDLLVIDFEAGTLSRFKPDGTPDNFTALGTNVIDGKGSGPPCTPPSVECDGTPQNGLFDGSPTVVQVAVDNSGGETDGNIYLTQSSHGLIDIFDSDGSYLGQLTASSEGPFGKSCGVAVDPSGDIYVGEYGEPEGKVHRYEPAASVPVNGDNILNFAAPKPCAVAAGTGPTSGAVFVTSLAGPVWKFNGSSGAKEYEVAPSPNTTVTVNPQTGHLYIATGKPLIDEGNAVKEYDVSGSEAKLLSSIDPPLAVQGVAVDEETGNVYVTERKHPQIEVWGPAIAVPVAITEEADPVGAESATLRGSVNPEGVPLTECFFEWGETEAYGQIAPCEEPNAAEVGAGGSPVSVHADISGLKAGSAYHFRLVAKNATPGGTATGLDEAFTTLGPLISAQSVEEVALSEATVSAKINPQGEASTYHVEYGTTAAYGQSTPESLPIGSAGDDSNHAVSVQIGGLNPGTTYHFRFLATNAAGSAGGPDTSFTTYPPLQSFEPCPNDQFRSGPGARLPDCRAYEQATPAEKHGANAQGDLGAVQAASTGDRVTFYTIGGLPESDGGYRSAFIASRGPSGWSYHGLLPQTAPGLQSQATAWNEDLSTSLVAVEEPGNVNSLYLRDSDTGVFQLATTGLKLPGIDAYVPGFAADPYHLVFDSASNLLPGTPVGLEVYSVYELNHGVLSLASRIPSGSEGSCDDEAGPACVAAPEGAFGGPYNWPNNTTQSGGVRWTYTQNVISRDGSKVFFTAAGSGQLYVREDGTRTTQVSASQRSVPDPAGPKPAAYIAATPDGSEVFFTSCEKLTDDSTAVCNAGKDLYSYETGTGALTDLTVDANESDANGADVKGVLGISDDGSYVYFAANGVLAPGASPGDCPPTLGSGGGTCNLYLSHNGTTTFIATVSGTDWRDWTPRSGPYAAHDAAKLARVSADGSAVLFSSIRSLSGYDNGGKTELFRWSAPSEELVCVSCNPTGLPPSGNVNLALRRSNFQGFGIHSQILPRNLSADGKQAFFESPDPLLASDTNGVTDVYEWEAQGAGSCQSAPGCIYLISTGTSPTPAQFLDASANGDHVFFFSDQQLVPGDRDQLEDVYDAGVGAGLASQHELTPPTCATTACQANPAPPPEETAASAVFDGPGNPHERAKARQCPKGKRKVRHAGKVRCQKQGKHHKRHSNRGGAK